MAKLAKFLRTVKRFRVLIIVVSTLIFGTVAALLSTRGIVSDSAPCPSEIVYGEPLTYKASAFMGSVTYEYRKDGGEWSDKQPKRAGKYAVRAVGRRIGGAPCYGIEHYFTITPKETTLSVSSVLVYGDEPTLVAELAAGDTAVCSEYNYADITKTSTFITPVVSSVAITDAAGEDVTDSYSLSAVKSAVDFTKRDIKITVGGASKEYDGTPLSCDEWSVSDGSLAAGDRVAISFPTSVVVPDRAVNTPVLDIIHGEDADVTDNYNVTVEAGFLTVTKRKISIATGDLSREYDGTPLECAQFTVNEITPLVEGDSALVTAAASVTDVGSAKNALEFGITDGYGNDVTDRYEIAVECGTLTVTPREITVKTGDGQKVYDGAPIYSEEHTVTDGTLLSGHALKVAARAEAVDAGSCDNALQLAVFEDETDISYRYNITYDCGTLTVDKRPLLVTAGDCTKVYDGTPLENTDGNNFIVASAAENSGLVLGHTVTVSFDGALTDAGRSQTNSISRVTVTADGKDVTRNYDITSAAGYLEVTPRRVTVETLSRVFVYNGAAQYDTGYRVTSELDLVQGHTLAAKEGYTTVTGVCAGVQNTVEFEISGTKSDNYIIETTCSGTLEVLPRPISISAGDCKKIYDGTPLVNTDNANFTVADGDENSGLVLGHTVTVSFDGALTDAGKERINEIVSVNIFADGVNVTENYAVTSSAGFLEVTARELYITTGSATFVYDGTPQFYENYSIKDKDESSGLVLDHKAVVASYTTVTDATAKPVDNVLTFAVTTDGDIVMTKNYDIKITYGSITVDRRPIEIAARGLSKVYDGLPLSTADPSMPKPTVEPFDGATDRGLCQGHWAECSYKQKSIVRATTAIVVIEKIVIYDASGKAVTENYKITQIAAQLEITKREIKVSTPDAEFVYNGEVRHSSPSVILCDGYLLADTDKFSIITYAYITDVGRADNIVEFDIVHNSLSPATVTDCYTITLEKTGTLTMKPRPITVKPKDKTEVYNGQFIDWYDGVEYTVYDEDAQVGLIDGHKIVDISPTGSNSGEPTDAGEYKHKFDSGKIIDGKGNYVTKNYAITYEYGTLTVTKRKATLRSGDGEWVYDGIAKYKHEWHFENLVKGHYPNNIWDNEFKGSSITDVGEVKNDYDPDKVKITTLNNVDVTRNYEINFEYGMLKITPRPLTVSVKDVVTKIYDGEPLKNTDIGNFTYTPFDGDKHIGLVVGQTVSVTFSGEITDVGTADNNISAVKITATAGGKEKDVTGNYEITTVSGILEVTVREVKIRTASNTWTYDGQPHFDTGWEYPNDEPERYPYKLLNGHTLEATYHIEITNVKESGVDGHGIANVVHYKVVDKNDSEHNVDKNYKLIIATGALKIKKRTVVIKTNSNSWVYDGEEHYDIGWDYVTESDLNGQPTEYELGLKLVDGHSLKAYKLTTVRNVSAVVISNIVLYNVVDADGSNKVHENYKLVEMEGIGKIQITPRPISVVTASQSWLYDGEEHSCLDFTYAEGSLLPVDGQTLEPTGGTKVRNVMRDEAGNVIGTDNELTFGVTGTGADIRNYAVTIEEYGELKIVPPAIKITSSSASFKYNNSAHTLATFEVTSGGDIPLPADLLSGIKAKITVSAATEFIDVVRDADGNVTWSSNVLSYTIPAEIADNYEISYEYGTVTVEPIKLEITTKSNKDAPWEYDGSAHSLLEINGVSLDFGHRVKVVGGKEFTDVGEYDNELTVAVEDESGTDKTGNYEISFTYGKVVITPREITVGAATEQQTKVYDGTPIECADYVISSGMLASGDSLTLGYNDVIYVTLGENGEPQAVDLVINKDSIVIVNSLGKIVTGNYDITVSETPGSALITPRPLKIKTGSGVWEYDGKKHSNSEYSIEGGTTLPDLHEIKVTKFAEIIEKGECPNVLELSIKYTYFDRDVTDCFKIEYDCGTLEVYEQRERINIVIEGSTKVYDGTPLKPSGKYTSVELDKLMNYTFSIVLSGEQTDVGSTTIDYSDIRLLDDKNNDVTKNYVFNVTSGLLTVTPRPVTITTGGDSKEYDGKPLTSEGFIVENGDDKSGLLSGHEVKLVSPASLTDAGKIQNKHTVKILSGDADVTRNYSVNWAAGDLVVTERIVEITTSSKSWVYDGAEHSSHDYIVTSGSLLEGHELSIVWATSIKHVWTTLNDISFTVLDINGKDISRNYKLTGTCGTLTVTPRPVTVATATDSWVYDGTAKSNGDYTVTSGSFADGESLVVNSSTEIVDAGFCNNTFLDYGIYRADGEGRVSDYEITWVYGILTVTPRPVTVIANSTQKIYDGTPLDKYEYYTVIEGDGEIGLIDGHGIMNVVFENNSITTPGQTFNRITSLDIVDLSGNVKNSNYAVTFEDGALVVVKRPIKVQGLSDKKYYDGTPLTAHGFICDPVDLSSYFDLLPGHGGSAQCDGSQTYVGSSPNRVIEGTVVIRDGAGNNVTEYYSIEYSDEPGTLVVEGETLTVITNTTEFVYDGNNHSDTGFIVYGLSEGDSADDLGAEVLESVFVRDVARGESGEVEGYENRVSYNFTGEAAKKYSIKVEYGTLTVLPATVYIKTASGAWRYDGEEHSNPSFKVGEGSELPQNHNITIASYATIVDIGSKENALELNVVRGADPGENVTGNFTFKFELGMLKVIADDGNGEVGDGDGDGEPDPFMWLYGEKDATVYLREESFNSYTGDGTDWVNSDSAEYGKRLVYDGVEYSANYLPSILLGAAGAERYTVDVKALFTRAYSLPYYKTLDGKHVQTSDIKYAPKDGDISLVDEIWQWSADYYGYNVRKDGGAKLKSVALSDAYAQFEREYSRYVYDPANGYLSVDDKTREYLGSVIEREKFSMTDPEIIDKVAKYIQSAASYNLRFDPMMEVDEDGLVIAFLEKYKEGLCRHYATAATMLFRTLGIPARYTLGIMSSVKAGEWTEVKMGHAWVEVYLDGAGWVYVEVTGSMGSGGGGNGEGEGGGDPEPPEDDRPVLVIKPVDVVEEYNGEVVKAKPEIEDGKAENVDALLLADLIAKGYSYTCEVRGEQNGVGESESEIVWFRLLDASGANVTDDYKIMRLPGKVKVVRSLIKIMFGDYRKPYDGIPFTIPEYFPGYAYFVTKKPSGVTDVSVDYKAYEGFTGVGTLTGAELAEIFVARGLVSVNGSTDVSDYEIVFENTSLTVDKIALKITTPSVSKPYDGNPVVFPEVRPTDGNMIEGHRIVVEYNKFVDITNGAVKNIPKSIAVYDKDGNYVTDFYDIEVSFGTVEIYE